MIILLSLSKSIEPIPDNLAITPSKSVVVALPRTLGPTIVNTVLIILKIIMICN